MQYRSQLTLRAAKTAVSISALCAGLPGHQSRATKLIPDCDAQAMCCSRRRPTPGVLTEIALLGWGEPSAQVRPALEA